MKFKIFFAGFIFLPLFLISSISFKEPSLLPIVFDAGRGAIGVCSEDFNGDGFLDVAVTGKEKNSAVANKGCLYVFLGNGDGSFQGPLSYCISDYKFLYGIVPLDFDKDGKIDLAAASNEEKGFYLFKGIGDGTFQNLGAITFAYRPEAIQKDDLNNDGVWDLILANYEDHNIAVFLGNGDGTFQNPSIHSTSQYPTQIATGDLNNDGNKDIIVSSYGDFLSLNVFLGDGTGTFPSVSTKYDTTTKAQGLYIADFDEDGILDAVIMGRYGAYAAPGAIGFVKGLGDGTFQVPVPSSNFISLGLLEDEPTFRFSPQTLLDLNKDGHKDIIAVYNANGRNYVTVGYGNGSGKFLVKTFVASPGDGTEGNLNPDNMKATSAVVEDFNGDGFYDILVTSDQANTPRGGSVSIIFGENLNSFKSPYSYSAGNAKWAHKQKQIETGDFNNDGKIDLCTITKKIEFFQGNGDGTFQDPQVAYSGGDGGQALMKADFDKDGNLDLIYAQAYVYNQPYTVYVIYGNGNGTFSFGNKIQWGSNGQVVENLIISDFNGDTYPDFATFSKSGDAPPYDIYANLDIFLYDPSNPRNFIHSASTPELDIGITRGRAIAAGDLDGDGKIDLVSFGKSPNRILFFKGLGDGTFQGGINAGTTGPDPYFDALLGDLNGDGKLDLVVISYDNAYISLGLGDGTFQDYTTINIGTSGSQISLNDLDNDGDLDLSIAHGETTSSDGFSVLIGNGDGTFEPLKRFAIGNKDNKSLSISDLNGDGKLDVVLDHWSSEYNYYTVLINNTGQRANLSVAKTLLSSNENIFKYSIQVINPGPDTATGVKVVDPIRSNSIILNAIPNQGTCQISSKNLTCNLLDIPPSTTVSITVEIQADNLASIENTASVYSNTEDDNTSNNGTTSVAVQDMKFIKLFGSKNVQVGTEETYSILYYNQLDTPLNDVVIVFNIPPTASYVSSSNNGIYRSDFNQVFWKLGNIPSKGIGALFVRISIPWGIPPHTEQKLAAMFGAREFADNPFDLDNYLNYATRVIIQDKNLTQSEIDDLLQSDPTLNEYHSWCQAYGSQFYYNAKNTLFDDGSSLTQLFEINPQGQYFIFPTKGDTNHLIEQNSKDYISFMDTIEGIRFYPDLSFSTFTTNGGPPPNLRQLTVSRCFVNCIIEKVPLYLLTKKIELAGKILDTYTCYKCVKGGNPDDCQDCLYAVGSAFAEKGGIPFVSEVYELAKCYGDCKNDPSSHICQAGTSHIKCEPANWFEKNILSQNVVERKYDCGIGGIYLSPPEMLFCAWCGYKEIQGCKNDRCACISCQEAKVDCEQGEVRTAHDPNFKEGMGEFVSPGQRLDFKINYENEGSGTAYDVYIVDRLDENLDDSTLSIQNGGTFNQSIRTIFWFIGELQPGEGGFVEFSVNVKDDAPLGSYVKNQATVVFPSAAESTPTNLLSAEIKAITAYSQDLQMYEGDSLPITLEGFDPLGLPLNYTITQNPINGEISGTPPNIIYTPYQNFEGQDEFKFTVDNGNQTSSPAAVKINVLSSNTDNIPPEVVTTTPLPLSSVQAYQTEYSPGVYLPIIKGCFNEPLDTSTVNNSNVILSDGANNLLGQIIFDQSDNCINFILSQPLSYGTQYTVTFLTGIKDTSGNNLAQDYSWSFFTYENAQINSNPNSIDFGNVLANQYSDKILEIYNTGESDLYISSVYITGTNQDRFSIQNDSCTGQTISPDSFCIINLRFSPDFNGFYEAYTTISSNVGNLDVHIFGNGYGGSCIGNLGDVNSNSQITASDASLILQAVVGLITLTPLQNCLGDVNENSSLTAFDGSLVLQCVVGLCSSLPTNFKTSCKNYGNCQ